MSASDQIKSFQFSLAKLAPIIVVLAGVATGVGAEPNYEGKSAAYWLECWNTNSTVASTAFKAMGTNAVPFLISVLERNPSKLGQLMDKNLTDYSLNHPGRIPNRVRDALPSAYRIEYRRETAAYLLGQLGPGAAAAIPTLFRIYTDTNESWRLENEVGPALGAMGEKGAVLLPHYLAWLTNSDPEVQATGASFLGSIGPRARLAIPDLVQAAESEHRRVATAAALALWSIDRQTNVALRVHTRDLQNSNSTVRQSALIHLGRMGSASSSAGPLVEPLLRDPDSTLREQAEKALGAIDPDRLSASLRQMNAEGDANIARLVQLLREGDFPQRYRALEVIALYGPSAKAAVPALIEALDGFSPPVPGSLAWTARMNTQREAAEALAAIGPEAHPAVPALLARVTINQNFQPSVCQALGCIGPPAKAAVPILAEAMRDDNASVRLAAAVALTRIVPDQCSNAVAVLQALQHDPVLARVWESDGHGAVRQGVRLDFENPQCRMYRLSAAVPLWKLGLEPASPAKRILEELGKPENAICRWCVELLGELGPEASVALPALIRFLEPNMPSGLRRAAAIAIRKIDPAEANRLNLPGVLAVP